MPPFSRRQALCALGAAALPRPRVSAADSFARLAMILSRIRPPQFPNRTFEITRYGARPGGQVDCTEAFRKAIDAAAESGGSVVVPEGVFLSGAIHLKSGVNLHLNKDATIRFSRDPRHYPIVLTRFEGVECMNYSPFIYSMDQQNIAVTGEGTLDGQADCDHWWPWKGRTNCGWKQGDPNQQKARDQLVQMAENGVPVAQRVFGEGGYLRPMFIQPYRSGNVLIEGVTIVNSPMYEIHPVQCHNVTVRGVRIATLGPNNDGCDPESSVDVLIDGCTFQTGDDCIAIKSGRNADGRRTHSPAENIVIQNCTMKDGHGGVTLGSECSGHIRNVFAQNCRMDSPHLERVLRFKDNAARGGILEHIYMRNVQAAQVAGPAIEVDFHYEEGDKGGFTPVVRDVEVDSLTVGKCRQALSLRGYANAPISDIRLRQCVFQHAAQPNTLEHVEGLSMEGVSINGKPAKSL
ncbi:MAG TPA: glycoside hydrolase family 28 protein [Bryobacteraceae bacterium]|nr:glycoside hydrolase family 28 protein [Bryobacteraceae bacterium]